MPGASTIIDVLPFVGGWLLGWAMLWRPRPLPVAVGRRPALSIVVPARNEEASLPDLLGPLSDQLVDGDELVVVDDHSTDRTAAVAREHGWRVVSPPVPAAGWLGKPHACWHGASVTTNRALVFLDADVRPRPGLLAGVAAALAAHPDAVVSVQPWHEPGGRTEQLSALFNVIALMGTGRFSILGGRVAPRQAFGAVLAVHREVYDAAGGHAAPAVRGAHTEDVELARAVGRAELHTGRPNASFRMYPGGLRAVVDGWTRTIATGLASSPAWASAATAGWVWALTAAPFVAWWAYLACVVQFWVLARRAGRFSTWLAVAYPLAVLLVVVVAARSLWRFVLRRDVRWKGRSVPAR